MLSLNAGSCRTFPEWFPLGGALLLAVGQFFLGRPDIPFSLAVGLVFFWAALFILLKVPIFEGSQEGKPLSSRLEIPCFLAVIALGFFLRFYRLHDFPTGVEEDRAASAWGALRILHEHWFPPLIQTYADRFTDLSLLYPEAVWFKLFGPSPYSFAAFDACLSLAAFPFIYWAFRQLKGPRAALATVFFLAVMRWHFNLGRGVNTTIEEMPLWMFLSLSLWLYALRTSKTWAFILSAACFAWGFYGYAGYKGFFVAALFFAAYEFIYHRREIMGQSTRLWLFLLTAVAVLAPLLQFMAGQNSLGRRETEVSLWVNIHKAHSLAPLWQNLGDWALMFNRLGDGSPQFNWPLHPVLDGVTGALFILGLALASKGFRRRENFYPLAGFFAMSLPAVLSTYGAHSGRAFGASPFVAYLAALGWTALVSGIRRLPLPIADRWASCSGAGLFIAAACLNFNTYFYHQARDLSCQNDFCPMETTVGRRLQEWGRNHQCFVSSFMFGPLLPALYGLPGKGFHPFASMAGGLGATGNPGREGKAFCFQRQGSRPVEPGSKALSGRPGGVDPRPLEPCRLLSL